MASKRIAGITIEIGGDTSDLQKSLKKVDSSIKSTQGELKDVNKLLKFDPKNTELLAQKQDLLKKSIADTKARLDTLKQASKQALDPEQYNALQREIIETQQNLQGLEAQYDKMGGEGESAVSRIRESFASARERISEFGANVREKVITPMLNMGKAAVDAGKQVYQLAMDAAATADHVDKMSAKLGLSRKAYQEWEYILGQSGASVDSLQAGMKTLRSSMVKAQKGAKDNVAVFKKLGVAVKNSKGQLRSQEDVFYDTVAALQKVSNETERSALATQLLGKSGAELGPLLKSGAGSVEQLRDQAHKLGIVLDDSTIDAGVKLGDTIDDIKRAFGAIKTQIGAAFMPAVQRVADWVLERIPKIGSTVGLVVKTIKSALDGILDFVEHYIVPSFDFITEGWQTVVDFFNGEASLTDVFNSIKLTISGTLENIITTVQGFVNTIYTKISENKGAVVQLLMDLFGWSQQKAKNVVDGVLRKIREIRAVFMAVLDGIKQFIFDVFTGQWEKAWEDIKGIFETVWTGVSGWFADIFNDAWKLISEIQWAELGRQIWVWITEAFTKIAEWFQAVFTVAKSLIASVDWKQLGADIWEFITAAFSTVGEWFKTAFEGAKQLINEIPWAEIGSAIWDGATAVFSQLAAWFQAVFTVAKSLIASIDWAQVGADIWNWITGAFATVGTWLQERFDEAVQLIGEIDWLQVGTDIWDKIKTKFADATEGVKNMFSTWFSDAMEAIKGLDWLEIGSAIWDHIKLGLEGFGAWLVGVFKTPINTVIGFFNDMIGKIEFGLNKAIRAINKGLMIDTSAVKVFGKTIIPAVHWSPHLGGVTFGRIKELANGGSVYEGGRAIVGEYAPEYLRVINGRAVVTPMNTGSAEGGRLGGTVNNTFNVYAQPGQDARQIAAEIQRIWQREDNQRRAAYA